MIWLGPDACDRRSTSGTPCLRRETPPGIFRVFQSIWREHLAKRLGLDIELADFDTAGKAFAALQSGTCDIGFLAIDPKRAEDLD